MRNGVLSLVVLLAGCAALPAAQETGPPLTDGLYVVLGACPGEGCELGAWVATEAGELRAEPDQNATITARVAAGENVEALESVLRLYPVRGEVLAAHQGLEVGDIVYRLDYQGEGFFNLWRRGETLTWSSSDDEGAINWSDADDEASNPRTGWWVRFRGAQGQSGWSRADGFQCRLVPSDPAHCQLM
ncbi:MAG: hypothetical protein JNJ73_02155 [Hyphomonadaceae bacterium]|nr:hypothetical protein [Hyphomonadaceae bacterium]